MLRAALYPHVDFWVGGPGLSVPVIRFGLWAGWRLSEQATAPAGIDVALHLVLLAPEVPYSVLPYSLQAMGILHEPVSDESWQGRPVPRWRGIPCRIGRSLIRLSDQGQNRALELPILVLLPDHDPPGPRPEVAYLGMEFLLHYGMDVVLRYSSFQYVAPETPTSTLPIDRASPAGYLEID
jgi:hypothetical protein